MNRIVSIIAASALISAALVGGLAAANGARAGAEPAVTATWTNPPAVEAGCRAECAAATPARKVRVIAIDGRAWPAGMNADGRMTARTTASR